MSSTLPSCPGACSFANTAKPNTKEAHTLNVPNTAFWATLTFLNRNPAPHKSWSLKLVWIACYFMVRRQCVGAIHTSRNVCRMGLLGNHTAENDPHCLSCRLGT